jgi:hypothetical protein
LDTLLYLAGFFLIFIFLSEDFQKGWQRLKAILQQRPRWKFFAYPLGALLFLGATGLIILTLIKFAALHFSYD